MVHLEPFVRDPVSTTSRFPLRLVGQLKILSLERVLLGTCFRERVSVTPDGGFSLKALKVPPIGVNPRRFLGATQNLD